MLLALAAILPGQWIDDPTFPRTVQERALAATVRVTPDTKRDQGSGVVIRYEKPFVYVLTAAHVVEGAKAAKLEVYAAERLARPRLYCDEATVFFSSPNEDVAVLRGIAEPPAGVLPVCPPSSIPKQLPFAAFTAGCSRGEPPTLLADRVLAAPLVHKPDQSRAFYWKAEKTPALGRSGGPLVDSRGLVIGVCSGTPDRHGFYAHTRELHKVFRSNVADWLYDEKAK